LCALKSTDPAAKPAQGGSRPSTRRRLLFRLCAAALPLLFLGGIETVLRVNGYGHRTGFFETIRVGGTNYLVNNEDFSLSFFPSQLARWPVPFMLEEKKPADTLRIFILGESAAMGDPDPAYGAGRFLEALLRERFPGRNFEVVNTGITAINSHVILPIARDCARRQGDVWIVYMGNNEMVGPFGAATVFGRQAPPLWFVRLNLALQQTRTGQWIMNTARAANRKSSAPMWGGMEMFLDNQLAPNDPRKEVVYRNFQQNLKDVLGAGLGSGAKVILNTVAVNLTDCPPFGTFTNSLSPADRSADEQLKKDGATAAALGRFGEACEKFAQAARLNAQDAELHFRWADCLARLTNGAAAREHYQLACDDDTLPFRADTRINGTIRQLAGQLAAPNLILLDAAAALGTNAATGACGGETFYEHVHFNLDGNYRLALAWAGEIAKLLPAETQGAPTPEWATQKTCERRLGLPDWNRSFVVQSVIWRLQRPPLSSQANNPARVAALQQQLDELRRQRAPDAAAQARDFHEAAIKQTPGDHFLYENFAKFLESIGDLKSAVEQWQQVPALMPHNPTAFYQVGRVLAMQRQWPSAESNLLHAAALRPAMHEAWFQLGNVHLGQENLEQALRDYDQARGLEPLDANYCVFTGKVLSKLNRRPEAVQRYRQALQINPDSWEAHFALGDELVLEDKIPEAQQEYEAVLALQPSNAMAHLNTGVALARQGKFDAALPHFEEALRLDPANQLARVYRDRLVSSRQVRP